MGPQRVRHDWATEQQQQSKCIVLEQTLNLKSDDEQYSEIEKNNRLGKTRDLLKKSRDTKGIFHAKMDTIKDRNSKDLTGAEEIKKRSQEYREEPYKKGTNEPGNHDGVITHLETWGQQTEEAVEAQEVVLQRG